MYIICNKEQPTDPRILFSFAMKDIILLGNKNSFLFLYFPKDYALKTDLFLFFSNVMRPIMYVGNCFRSDNNNSNNRSNL